MPFQLTSEVANYPRVDELLKIMNASIRPIGYTELSIKGSTQSTLEVTIDGYSYYQPSKGLTIEKEVLKK